MALITIPHRFTPRDYQVPLLRALDDGFKRAFICWHRRAGKDKALWNFLIKRASQVVGQHFYFFPTYTQGKKILWEGIDNDGMSFLDHVPKELLKSKNDTEMKIVLNNGSIIQIIGTDNFDSIRGTNPKTCIFSEYAFQDPRVWDVVRPILRVNGGIAIFNTTPNGENHAKELWDYACNSPEWFTQLLTVDDTHVLSEKDIQDERDSGMSEEMIQQEYYCSWSASAVGAYYSKYIRSLEEKDRIITDLFDDARPVRTYWDIGVDDEMFILFVQQHGFSFRVIDNYTNHGEGFEHYAKAIKERPYIYTEHCLPHDAKVRDLSKSKGEGMERYKTLDSLLREPIRVLNRPKAINDKIEASRWALQKCYFDKEKADFALKCLKNYHQQFDPITKKWRDEPAHDWSSHGADAFAYFALDVRHNPIFQLQEGSNSGILEQNSLFIPNSTRHQDDLIR